MKEKKYCSLTEFHHVQKTLSAKYTGQHESVRVIFPHHTALEPLVAQGRLTQDPAGSVASERILASCRR